MECVGVTRSLPARHVARRRNSPHYSSDPKATSVAGSSRVASGENLLRDPGSLQTTSAVGGAVVTANRMNGRSYRIAFYLTPHRTSRRGTVGARRAYFGHDPLWRKNVEPVGKLGWSTRLVGCRPSCFVVALSRPGVELLGRLAGEERMSVRRTVDLASERQTACRALVPGHQTLLASSNSHLLPRLGMRCQLW